MVSIDSNEEFQQLFAEPRFVDLDDNLRNLIASLAQELASRPHDLPLQQHISGLLLHSLFHRIAPYRHPSHTHGGRIDMAMLDQLIAERLTDKIGVDELASACHMSSSQFHLQAFNRAVGIAHGATDRAGFAQHVPRF